MKHFLIAALVALSYAVLSVPEASAQTLDANCSGVNGLATTVTFSCTVASNTDDIMVCGAFWNQSRTFVSSDFNSDSLTTILTHNHFSGGTYYAWLGYLLNPDTGTLTFTLETSTGGAQIAAGCTIWYGASWSLRDSASSHGGTGADPSDTVTSVSGDLVFSTIGWEYNGASPTHAPSGGETERWDLAHGSVNTHNAGVTEVASGASTSIDSDLDPNTFWSMVVASFDTSSGGAATNHYYGSNQ